MEPESPPASNPPENGATNSVNSSPRITEARLAIVFSALALAIATWQAFEARRANALNSEDLKVEASIASPLWFDCTHKIHEVRIRWQVLVSNNSLQPSLIRSVDANALRTPSDDRLVMKTVFLTEDSAKTLPLTIAPRSYATFTFEQTVQPRDSLAKDWPNACKQVGALVFEGLTVQTRQGVSVFAITGERLLGVSADVKTSTDARFVGSGVVFQPVGTEF